LLPASCYPDGEIVKLLEMGIDTCELWATPEERISNAGKNIKKISKEGRFPYGSHSIRLYSCFAKFVENIVEHIYTSEDDIKEDTELQNFARHLHDQVKLLKFHPPEKYETKSDVIKVLATFMFNATGMHEYFGTALEYLNSPRKLGFRLRDGFESIDFQSWLILLMMFTTTRIPMPMLLEEFPKCYTKEYERESWIKCLDSLRNLSSDIQKENEKTLKYPFRSFDPQLLECSVNV
jgi:hypothetical protein